VAKRSGIPARQWKNRMNAISASPLEEKWPKAVERNFSLSERQISDNVPLANRSGANTYLQC